MKIRWRFWPQDKDERFQTITPDVATAVLKLHKANPIMGTKRLHAELANKGLKVDRVELKRFLRTHGIGTPPSTRQGYYNPRNLPWM